MYAMKIEKMKPSSEHKLEAASKLERYDGDRYEANLNGFDLNNYEWLDEQSLCISRDWYKAGQVGFPKNQGLCGSCWAHTTTAALETLHAKQHHTMWTDDVVSFSEQQIVDCSLVPNLGCLGGEQKFAFRYI